MNEDLDEHQTYGPITIKLEKPLEFDGQLVSTLTMRPPCANDVLNPQSQSADGPSADRLMYANLTDTSPEFIGQLSYYDYRQLDGAFRSYSMPVKKHLELCALHYQEQAAA